jgi:hypothetical protein
MFVIIFVGSPLSLSNKGDYATLVQVIAYFNFEIKVFGNIKGGGNYMEKLVAIAMAMSSFVYLGHWL